MSKRLRITLEIDERKFIYIEEEIKNTPSAMITKREVIE